jgi:hypothetical protein
MDRDEDALEAAPDIGRDRHKDLTDLIADGGRTRDLDELIDRDRPDMLGSAVANFSRRGTLRFNIGFNSSIRTIPIETLGVTPDQYLRENGDETEFLSSCQFLESVEALDLRDITSEWEHPLTKVKMTYATAETTIPLQWQGVVLNGGRMKGGRTTEANANLRVTSYNSVVFGPNSSQIEHWLFIAGPVKVIPSTDFPEAKRNFGTFRLLVVNESDNNAPLLDASIEAPSPGTGGFAIQATLRKNFPDMVFNGKRIGFQVIHQVADNSPSPNGPDQRVLGALSGFGMIQMKPK